MSDLDQAVSRIMAGDTSAFRELVEMTSDRLVRLAARLLGSLSEAEDVVQESYLSAYQALVQGRFDRRSSVETWMYRIVTNRALDWLRSRKRRPSGDDAALDPSFDGVVSAETRVALRELEDWLGALPAEQRVALTLKSIEGLSSAEVAQILGRSEGAVEQLLVRARSTLRRQTEEQG